MVNKRNWPTTDTESIAFVKFIKERGDSCEVDECGKLVCVGPCCFPPDYATMHHEYCHSHTQQVLGRTQEKCEGHFYQCVRCGQLKPLRVPA